MYDSRTDHGLVKNTHGVGRTMNDKQTAYDRLRFARIQRQQAKALIRDGRYDDLAPKGPSKSSGRGF